MARPGSSRELHHGEAYRNAKMDLEFKEELTRLRRLCIGVPPRDILDECCVTDILELIDDILTRSCNSGSLHFDYLIAPRIAENLPDMDDAWRKIQRFCDRRLGDDLMPCPYLLECLVYVLKDDRLGAWIDQDVLSVMEPNLLFDKDQLLVGPTALLQFEKEGVLTARHWLRYHKKLPGTGLVGGFVDDLLALKTRLRETPAYFGLAVESDSLLRRCYHGSLMTRAYIRGPRGLSETMLQDASFPQDESGTVTQHRRVGENPLFRLFPLDRLEIMWSQRGGIKSVQIEELIKPGNTVLGESGSVRNRYVHARWDPKERCFTHFDGAIRAYDIDKYGERLRNDIKKYPGKSTSYRKLFRIDAPLGLDTWSTLVTKFFHPNELILEYLGGT